MDLWNAFSAAVKQQTQELSNTIQGTDWKTELASFQQGLKDDTEDIGHMAKAATEELGHKTIDFAKQLPTVVEQGKQKAAATLESIPTSSTAVQIKAKEATTSISNVAHRLVHNTTELFEQVSSKIQTEMASVQQAASSLSSSSSFKNGKNFTAGNSKSSISTTNQQQFNRFDADMAALQRDSATYCEEPEDKEGFAAWKSTFNLDEAHPQIQNILSENTFMSELHSRIVPTIVDYDIFWTRYFYRVHTVEEKHAKVVALTLKMSEQGMSSSKEDHFHWGDSSDDELEGKIANSTDGDVEVEIEEKQEEKIEDKQVEVKGKEEKEKEEVEVEENEEEKEEEVEGKQEEVKVEDKEVEVEKEEEVDDKEVEKQEEEVDDKEEEVEDKPEEEEKEKEEENQEDEVEDQEEEIDEKQEEVKEGNPVVADEEGNTDEDWGDDVADWE